MHLLHLALPTQDVLRRQAFYEAYFGFQPARGPGFLIDKSGFVLVLDPGGPEGQVLPEDFHIGFQADAEAVRGLYARMLQDEIPVDTALSDGPGGVNFYCRDPEGLQVEVREEPRAAAD